CSPSLAATCASSLREDARLRRDPPWVRWRLRATPAGTGSRDAKRRQSGVAVHRRLTGSSQASPPGQRSPGLMTVVPSKGRDAMPTASRRAGLLALALTFSAGIHAALAPEHLKEMPPLGYAFLAAAIIGAAIAAALIAGPRDRRVAVLAGLFCFGQIATWVLFVTLPVPGFSGPPEPIEPIALVSKAVELVGLALVYPLAVTGLATWRKHSLPTPQPA